MEALILIAVAVSGRLLPHPANFTPVGAVALFSGWRLGFRTGILVSFTSMMLSDLILGFHPVMWATYGSVLLSVSLGKIFFGKRNFALRIGVTVISSVVFYLATNFAVWFLPDSMYPHTWQGLLTSYTLALPFFRNSLLADLTYTVIFSAGYEIAGLYRVMTRPGEGSA